MRIELSFQRVLVDPSADVTEMLAVAEDAIEVFDAIGDAHGLSRARSHIAQVHWTRSRCREMEAVLEHALRDAERAGAHRERSRILRDLARATVIGPRPVDAGIRRCHEILRRADDDVTTAAVADAMIAVLEAMRGDSRRCPRALGARRGGGSRTSGSACRWPRWRCTASSSS